jgi:hypothetical protein
MKFSQYGIQGYYINSQTLSIKDKRQNTYEYLTESRLEFIYSNMDPESIYYTGKLKHRLVKPSYFSGTTCVMLRDYIACVARMTLTKYVGQETENGESEAQFKKYEQYIQTGANFLMVWKKPIQSKIVKSRVHTTQIVRLKDAPFSTRNALMKNTHKPNTVLYVNKKGYVVETRFDRSKITFKLKKNAQKPYFFKLKGTPNLENVEGVPKNIYLVNELEMKASDFIIPREKFFSPKHIALMMIIILILVTLLICFCCCRQKDLKEEELISSFMDESNPEVRRITMRPEDEIRRS